jgi:hypothetical protein
MANSNRALQKQFPISQFGRNPILLRFCPALSPECFALAFFAFAISRSNIPCVTFQRSGFASVLPA